MPIPHIPEEELFRRLEEWEAYQPSPPTLWDAVRQHDGTIIAAYITRNFRLAAREAVLSRDRVAELRQLALLAFDGNAAETEGFLRAPSLLFGRTPLEAAVESNDGLDEALRGLAILLQKHTLNLVERIAGAWALGAEECISLLGVDAEKLKLWRSRPLNVPLDIVVRAISLLMMDKAMVRHCRDSKAAREWLRTPQGSAPFYGESALTLVTKEGRRGIVLVRDHLDKAALAG